MNQGKETKEIVPQPGLKRFNLNLSLTCNIYKHWHGPVHKVVNLIKCHAQIHTTDGSKLNHKSRPYICGICLRIKR